ncbi:L-rhamnose mutarotase [compost metagenome]
MTLLKDAGIEDYSIYLDEEHLVLFAVLRRRASHTMASLPQHPVMQRWWQHMRDIMRCHPDGSPVAEDLPCLFHLD